MSFDPALPKPRNENWRNNYGVFWNTEKRQYTQNFAVRFSTYQAPGGSPIPFVLDNIRLSGGQSVDTAEYAFHGFWSSTSLNEKPHAININGFVRGENYIRNRNALVEAFRVKTDDENTGFIELPQWGRFPVVVESYDVEEKGKENGQCSISITFTRAGVTINERWKSDGNGFDIYGQMPTSSKLLEEAAISNFERTLEGNIDTDALASGFTQLKIALISVIGRIQGAVSTLNQMTNAATGITNLIAQGVRSPRDLAEALFGAAASIVSGVMSIKNSWDDTKTYFKESGNHKKLLLQFLSADSFKTDMETATIKQHVTKDNTENLYRAMALSAAAQILVQMDMTYQEASGLWSLYEKLEASVDQNDPEVYRAIRDMRLAASRELSSRKLDNELLRAINLPVPLLYLSHILGCSDEKIRQLNSIPDSFIISGDIIYV